MTTCRAHSLPTIVASGCPAQRRRGARAIRNAHAIWPAPRFRNALTPRPVSPGGLPVSPCRSSTHHPPRQFSLKQTSAQRVAPCLTASFNRALERRSRQRRGAPARVAVRSAPPNHYELALAACQDTFACSFVTFTENANCSSATNASTFPAVRNQSSCELSRTAWRASSPSSS